MEEKILQELQNIRIELQGIRSILEFENINYKLLGEKSSKAIIDSLSNSLNNF